MCKTCLIRRSFQLTWSLALLCALAPDAATAKETVDESLPNLNEELEKISNGFAKKAPESMLQAFTQGIADVRKTGILETAQKVGDKAADADLLLPSGEKARLSSFWAKQPLVVVFYRGGWCPYCNAQLRAMEQSINQLQDSGAKLVVITPELPESVQKTAEKNNLSMMVLTDKGNTLARKMGIAFRLPNVILPIYQQRVDLEQFNGDNSYELPLAATYVIDSRGVIRYAFLDADYKKRAEPKAILEAVKNLP